AALGLVGLVQFLPVLLLSLPAGHLADRYNRKKLLQTAQVGFALSSLALAALSWLEGPVVLVYLCLLLGGSSRALGGPARGALLAQVVPAPVLANAVTWNSSGWHVASVSGPALGGLVIALTDQAAPAYLAAAACSLTCATLLMPIRPQVAPRPVEKRSL